MFAYMLTMARKKSLKMSKKKNPAAMELGRKGGKVRASRLTPQERQESARKAVQARWAKRKDQQQ